MSPIPDALAEQAPYLIILALVIGWLLYTGQRDRKAEAAAREKNSAFIQNLVTSSEADRKEQMEQWREDNKAQQNAWQRLLAQSIEIQRSVCTAIETHEREAARRDAAMLKAIERINGKH